MSYYILVSLYFLMVFDFLLCGLVSFLFVVNLH